MFLMYRPVSKTHSQSSSNHKSVPTFGPFKKTHHHHHRSKSDANGKIFSDIELLPLLHSSMSSLFQWQRCYVYGLFHCPVCLSGQIFLPRYLMNSLNNFDKT